MSESQSYTAEHRSWEWELAMQFEELSLPPTSWNEATLAVIAGWYAKTLAPDAARARYANSYHRNRRRLENRLTSAAVDVAALEALDAVWEQLLEQRLPAR